MKKNQFFNFSLSFFYALVKIAVGLLLHPYQTMFSLIKEKVFWSLVFTPTLVFIFLTFFWRLAIRSLVLYFFNATCLLMTIKTSVLFFCFFWQLALFYLWLKFYYFWRR